MKVMEGIGRGVTKVMEGSESCDGKGVTKDFTPVPISGACATVAQHPRSVTLGRTVSVKFQEWFKHL